MLKRILYGSGAIGVLTAGYMLGSVTLGAAFAQAQPAPSPTAQSTPSTKPRQEANEQAESAALASQAKITADQANAAALAQFPGATIHKIELENENGTVVYEVRLTDSAGKKQEVKVDAGNASVLPPDANDDHGGRDSSDTVESGETAD